jgi:hypothetical protein
MLQLALEDHLTMKTPSWLLDFKLKKMRARAVALVALTSPQDMVAQVARILNNSSKAAAVTPRSFPLEIGALRVVVVVVS